MVWLVIVLAGLFAAVAVAANTLARSLEDWYSLGDDDAGED